jgi:hypothetical protein
MEFYLGVIFKHRHALVFDSHFESRPGNFRPLDSDHVAVEMLDRRFEACERVFQRNCQVRVQIVARSLE